MDPRRQEEVTARSDANVALGVAQAVQEASPAAGRESDAALRRVLETALGQRYAIGRLLGQGGMGAVYLVGDRHHDRPLALKVLLPEVAAALGATRGADRFLREIRISAHLSHPHIVALYDSGRVDGLLYYTMPYVPGESLRDRLRRERQLPLHDAITLARQVASALDYAHRQGVVHRDVKPENILLHEGEALVADFGIARALHAQRQDASPQGVRPENGHGGSGGAHAVADVVGSCAVSTTAEIQITATGLALGTPLYMSPEQAVGEPVDDRSDIYALGCVVYEMLAGEPPFNGASASAILARKLAEDTPPLGRCRSGLPTELDGILARAMRCAPADRFASAEEFASALARAVEENRDGNPAVAERRRARAVGLVVGGVVVLALGGVAVRARRWWSEPEVRSIAVLPIVADSAYRPLADEIHARLIDDLAHVRALRVTGATSASRASTQRPKTIARDLDVDALVDATLTPLRSDSVSLDLRLRPGRAAVSSWTREFVTDFGHLERFRKQVARTLLESLHLPLTPDERRWLARYRVTDPRAAEAYARGQRMAASFDPGRFEKSIAAFEEAIRNDPDDPAPYVALAETYQGMVGAGHIDSAPAEMLGRAKAVIDRALELDPDDAEAHVVKAGLLYMFDWNWAEADREFRRAVTLNPGSGKAHWQYGAYLRFNGWRDSAIAELRRAARIDPLNPMFLSELSVAYAWADRGDSAVRWARAAVELEPNMMPVRYARSHGFLATGQLDSAIAEGKKAVALNARVAARLAEVYVVAGRKKELEQLIGSMPKPIEEWFWLLVAARQGNREVALRYLETMAEQRTVGLYAIRGDPAYASLASEPRYQAVLARMGLPPRPVSTAPRRIEATRE